MPRLLFEIGCEELPASACREAEAQLRSRWLPALGGGGTVFVGPRRLALLVEDVPEREPDQWVQGPPVRLREQAAEGFARKLGVSAEDLEERDGVLGLTVPGRPLAEALPGRLAELAGDLGFGKSMVWEAGGLRFSRPVRWLCALLDADTLELEVAGLLSGNVTYGHRFTHGAVEVPDAGAYVETLRNAGVEPDQAERRRLILEGLDAIGGWSDPAGVIEEVVFLVESPIVLAGEFDERFLDLPPRVVQTAMQSHQRYFPLEGVRFAFVANGGDPATVVAGNERVLEGRLEDAHFTFERDVAKGIEALASELGSITFAAGAGSYADKTARLVQLAAELGGGEASQEAARLAKADQAAELVREFPDLEGHIGAEYARLAGFPEAVCAAIDEQYLPDSADGPLPQTEPGRVLAAAERIDNLTVAFALGRRPTGSRDPLGLRRAAIGLCRLAVGGGLAIDVGALVRRDLALLVEQGAEVEDDPSDAADFVLERLEGLLDVPVEFVRAARAGAVRELGAVARLAETLAAEASSEEFDRAYVAFDRANRLAGKADGAAPALDPVLATDEAEVALVEALGQASPRIDAAVAERDFRAAIAAAGELGPPVDRFFDEVLVMAEDASVRANRLRLLLDVRDAVGALGDLSQIPR
ncbi:MAG TPA: glycine--tRNA ligase subunit beta [Gaiellaceae bacterium]|nr:glycine--tRNA ligase subunit beta [Gaiellaceae bacterium]